MSEESVEYADFLLWGLVALILKCSRVGKEGQVEEEEEKEKEKKEIEPICLLGI